MAATTPDGLRYPLPSDNPNVPRDIAYLAADTQAALAGKASAADVAALQSQDTPFGQVVYPASALSPATGWLGLAPSSTTLLNGMRFEGGGFKVPETGMYAVVCVIRYWGLDVDAGGSAEIGTKGGTMVSGSLARPVGPTLIAQSVAWAAVGLNAASDHIVPRYSIGPKGAMDWARFTIYRLTKTT